MKLNSVLSITLIVLLFLACKKDTLEITGYDEEILVAVNNYRTSIGLNSLEHNDFLWQLAHEHSQNMADSKSIIIDGGKNERYDKIKKTLGLGDITENVTSGSGTGAELVAVWLASVKLKENIEGNYELTGVSAVPGENGTWYYTEIFYKAQ